MAKDINYLEELKEKYEQYKAKDSAIEVISTGSTSLDISTDVGGVPLGKVTMVYGPFSSAKTTLCLNISKQAVDRNLRVLYIDAEISINELYIKSIVGDLPKSLFDLYHTDTAETALSLCEDGIRSGYYDLIVLDSLGALAPEEELKKDLGDKSIAIIPRLLSSFFRRNAYEIQKNNVAFVLVNQVRANIGTYFGGYDFPGGNALKHIISLSIQLSRSSYIKQTGSDEIIGLYSTFTIKKNKVGKPFKSFTFPLIFKKGIDRVRDVIDFAEMLGVLKKRGSYYAYGDETLAQGIAKTQDYLEQNPEVLDKIINECYNITNIQPNYASREREEDEQED